MGKISFNSDGYALAGHLFKATKPNGLAFLFIQGWKGHQNVKAAQKLAGMGFTCLTYDMRGNGGSEGELADFSRADFLRDAVVAYDYLRSQVGEETKIGVVGSSFGSYTAVLLTEKRDVHCLSLRVPATYPDEGFGTPQLPHIGTPALLAWRGKALDYTQNRAFNALHNFAGKVQIVEAGADETVTHQAPQNYADALQRQPDLRYDVMAGAPHSLTNDTLQHEYETLLTGWAKMFIHSGEMVDIVADGGAVTRQAFKTEAHEHGWPHKVVIGYLRDGDNWRLVRQAADRQDAGQLVAPVGGHVQAGESDTDALLRECEEEIGTANITYTEVGRAWFRRHIIGRDENHLFIIYEITTNDPVVLGPEADAIVSFTKDELKQSLVAHPDDFGEAYYFVLETFYPDYLPPGWQRRFAS